MPYIIICIYNVIYIYWKWLRQSADPYICCGKILRKHKSWIRLLRLKSVISKKHTWHTAIYVNKKHVLYEKLQLNSNVITVSAQILSIPWKCRFVSQKNTCLFMLGGPWCGLAPLKALFTQVNPWTIKDALGAQHSRPWNAGCQAQKRNF